MRVIDEQSQQLGIMDTKEAIAIAESRGFDLVEVSGKSDPPVCRIMDFGKYRYEESRKDKQAKKHQGSTVIKEIKFHANVEEHDYRTKLAHIHEFLKKGHRIKASLLFRGRENEHRDLGYNLINRLIKDCESTGVAESSPRMFGNNMVIIIRPLKV